MKSRRSAVTMAIYFLFTFLWLALFINASVDQKETIINDLDDLIITPERSNITDLENVMTPELSNVITQNGQQEVKTMHIFFFFKFVFEAKFSGFKDFFCFRVAD